MDLALIASAGLMGLAGAPHCAAMCGAPCGALTQRRGAAAARPALAAFMGGRVVGYMLGGAAVAAGIGLLSAAGALAPALRPLWVAAHAATLVLGGWMLVAGQLPGWLGRLGRAPTVVTATGWQPVAGPLRARAGGVLGAGAAGTLWVAMPCGLLQSALIVAALASTPWQGAAAMGAFAATSSLGLVALPAFAWQRAGSERATRWLVRGAGGLLVAASGWALAHGLWQRIAAWCGSA